MSKLNSALTEVATKTSWMLAIRHDYDYGASKIDYSATVTRTNKRMHVCLFDCWFSCFARNNDAATSQFCCCYFLSVLFALMRLPLSFGTLEPQYPQTCDPTNSSSKQLCIWPFTCLHVFVCVCIYTYLGGARPSATFTSVRYIEPQAEPLHSLPPPIPHPPATNKTKMLAANRGSFAHSLSNTTRTWHLRYTQVENQNTTK